MALRSVAVLGLVKTPAPLERILGVSPKNPSSRSSGSCTSHRVVLEVPIELIDAAIADDTAIAAAKARLVAAAAHTTRIPNAAPRP